jgi:chaperone required for assembly of F1-ATPase
MNMLDLIYRYDQWGMRQNHVGHRNNNRLDDPNCNTQILENMNFE